MLAGNPQVVLDGRVRRFVHFVRRGPLAGLWLFGWVLAAQLGHLIEHISVAIQGRGLLGSGFDSELSHLLFNGAIALLSTVVVLVYPRNPWVYPLVVISFFHGAEHVYIYEQYVRTHLAGGPGLLGSGGAIGLIPLARLDLHNAYNGLEVILMVLGCWYEVARITLERTAGEWRGSFIEPSPSH